MPRVPVRDALVNYVQHGPDRPRGDIVFVHGLATSLAFWYFQYALTLSETYRVTLFDLRGHGRSTMSDSGYHVGDLARDLESLLCDLGIERPHLVGHSFGGAVALSFAARHPDKTASLALFDVQTSLSRRALSERRWEHGEKLRGVLRHQGIELDPQDPYFGFDLLTELARLLVNRGDLPDDMRRLVSPLLGKHGARTARQWLRLLDSTRASTELRQEDGLDAELLGRMRVPILSLYGSRSQAFTTSERLLSLLPHTTLHVLENAGHFFPSTHVKESMAALTRFWERRESMIMTRDREEVSGASKAQLA